MSRQGKWLLTDRGRVKMKVMFPPECPLVFCGECLRCGGTEVPIELNGDVLVYKNGEPDPVSGLPYDGESCVEFCGVECWNRKHHLKLTGRYEDHPTVHGAIDPIPLTPFAAELLAALKEEVSHV